MTSREAQKLVGWTLLGIPAGWRATVILKADPSRIRREDVATLEDAKRAVRRLALELTKAEAHG